MHRFFGYCRRCVNPWVIGVIIVGILVLLLVVPIVGLATLIVMLPFIGCAIMCGAMAFMMRGGRKR